MKQEMILGFSVKIKDDYSILQRLYIILLGVGLVQNKLTLLINHNYKKKWVFFSSLPPPPPCF